MKGRKPSRPYPDKWGLWVAWEIDHYRPKYSDHVNPIESTADQHVHAVIWLPRQADSDPSYAALRLLHLLLPKRDRAVIERDLEEQFHDELLDPRIGPHWAQAFYWKRMATTLLIYAWDRVPKRLRKIVIGAFVAGALKSLGLLPALAALKDLGLLPWK